MGTARAAAPPARPERAWNRVAVVNALSVGAQILAVALATAWLSRTLVELSGTALRLPPPWGRSVQIVMPLFGVGVFAFARHLAQQSGEWYLIRKLRDPQWTGVPVRVRTTRQERLDEARKRAQSRSRTVATFLGALLLLGVLAAIFSYNRLHERCAWTFTVPLSEPAETGGSGSWYWEEWGDSRPFPRDPLEQETLLSELDGKLPRFLHRPSNTIYMPLRLPADVRAMLEGYGHGDADRGAWDLLASEYAAPVRLIDQLQRSGTYAELMDETRLRFYLLHALVIALLSLAVGVLFAPAPELAGELVAFLQ